ncbi:phage tail fiber protein [Acinetobacter baumannii]|uniref:phage tail fiber protein n=1 Tax=Acinetobacter baumannii TaxID=470 RepID=UPI0022A1B473|nr:hypothetical protein [Acinetobacter baumannii]HCT9564429.1 hypothetical protein [Acinetobacter baumannii]
MAVPEQTPFIEYTANGTTTVFPVPFQCDKAEYLIVNLDGNEAPVGSWSFVNGSITFNTAPANGVLITIERNTPFRRTTEYQSYNNSFRPSPVNKDFDLIWWKLQELGVADWILGNRIDALKNYVDDRDDELRAYLMEEIRKQGVALDQLDEYYNYLMQRLAQIAVDKGWDASFVVDGDKTQKQINEEQNERKSVKLWATSLVDALSKYNSVDFDEDENINAPVTLMSGQNITSNNHELNQKSPTTIAIESDYSAADTSISGLHIVQDKTGPISGGTNNNHASIKYHGGLRNIIRDVVINGQLGISFGMGEIGSSDRRSKYNTAENIVILNTHMGVEHIGSSYNHTRNIVIAPTEFKGIFHGIRLTGYDEIENPAETAHAPCHGNTGSDYFIKNMTNGVSAQNSAKYNSYDRIFVTETDRAVHLLQGTIVGNNPTMNHFDVIGEKVGQAIVNQGGNHNDFEILIDGGAFTDQGIQELTGYTGKGFNRYRGIIKNSAKTGAQFRYSHNLYALQVSLAVGNGVNINGSYGNGPITVSGATGTGVSLAGNYNNLQVVATECLTALAVAGSGNIVNIQTDGNVQVSGSGNTIIGRIGGSLTVTGNDNKFIGEVAGTVTRTGTTGNDFTGLKGWSGNIVLSEQITDGSGRVTVAVPKHTSAQIRNIYATIPTNTSEWNLKVISISGANVMFELQDNAGNAVASTAIAFNYAYSCS